MAHNFPKHIPHKLHMVTLLGSGIRRPYWEKRILKKLGLVKRLKTVVLKNTPDVNKDLEMIKTLIEVRPIIIKEKENGRNETTGRRIDLHQLSSEVSELNLLSAPFLNQNGEFVIDSFEEYLKSFPKDELKEVLSKSHYEGSDSLNHDYYMEEEKKIVDKGEQIGLYFKKKTWHHKTRLQNRLRNISKY